MPARSNSRAAPLPTVRPSRSTVMRSATAKISVSRCDTKIVATPWPPSRRTIPKSDSTSSSVRRARRLVEDEHPGVDRERSRDLHQLLLIRAQLPNELRGVQVEAEPGQRLRRPSLRTAPVDQPEAAKHAVPEKDVLGDRQIGGERRLLRDHGDALAERVRRAAERGRPAREHDLSAVGGRSGRRGSAAASTSPTRSRPRSACTSPG